MLSLTDDTEEIDLVTSAGTSTSSSSPQSLFAELTVTVGAPTIGLAAEGKDRCLDAVLQAEFGEDAAGMGLDGLLATRLAPSTRASE